MSRRIEGLRRLVGNTPLLTIDYRWRGRRRTIYAKSEQLNLTGSIKDRMALQILVAAYREGKIAPGDTIAAATVGNSGISFAAIGRALGHPVTIFMPQGVSDERMDLISSFGAEIVIVTAEQGGLLGAMRMVSELAARDPRVFLPSQFSNEANPADHEQTTGPEIHEQLAMAGRVPDAFVAGVGTGGTVMGVGRCLRRFHPAVRVYPLEPAESPMLSTGQAGRHRIQGIAVEFVPPVLNLRELEPPVAVHDGDAILLAQKLARELGLGVGISSGANLAGAIDLQNRLGGDAVVVTVFPDSNKKYLSTDLLREEPAREGYLAPDVELTRFSALPRVCSACSR
jgi:cysteine synthase A